MAMITRFQAEKSGVHMEALQYQRMMDKQSEYDEEAIQILKDLLLKKRKTHELEKKVKYIEQIFTGVILAKELVNAPTNVVTPVVLAEEAEKIAASYSDVMTAKISDTEQCVELKMGSYLGVADASTDLPKFIHLCYKPPSESIKTKLAMVGERLNFDSGGYNIKTGPGCSIEMMNCDMGSSSAVLGAVKALGQIKPQGVEVHFIVAPISSVVLIFDVKSV
ncbi:peptidase M17, leucine aminopeptidase/peptidase B [Artemisia annua]|uniref:Peptidase M17, leucine aminopeptidase/peptidase B n=1 Tax=Artemisia annua TaxID=35608 RepID=A0A2U1MZK4_ARTAN|nr:peptidase M17, leucine aminopeptidase/peptidase B [Artemisia annua]